MSENKGSVALTRLHRVLISMGIALAIVFGVYQYVQLSRGADGAVAWMITSGLLAALLSVYLVWFNKKQRG